MRTFTDREQQLIRALVEWQQGKPSDIEWFLIQHYFNEASGQALIIQVHRQFAALYIDAQWQDETRREIAEREFFETLSLLMFLKTNGYITIHRSTASRNRSLYFFHESFNKPRVEGNTIYLNDRGDFTAHPESILDKQNKPLFNGFLFDRDTFELIVLTMTGTVVVSHALRDLVGSWQQPPSPPPPPPKSATSDHFQWLWSLLLLVLLGLSGYLVYRHEIQQAWLQERLLAHGTAPSAISVEQIKPSEQAAPVKAEELVQPPSNAELGNQSAGEQTELYGIDVSRWDVDVASNLAQLPNVSFAISKATEGLSVVDPSFHGNWQLFIEKDLIVGAYHFYHHDDDAESQARFFAQTVGEFGPNTIAPIVDIEQASLPTKSPPSALLVQTRLLRFLRALETATKRQPIIYTDFAFAEQYLNNPALSRYRLWLAEYQSSPPKLPSNWLQQGLFIWQKQSDFPVGDTHVDWNVFVGSKADLTQ